MVERFIESKYFRYFAYIFLYGIQNIWLFLISIIILYFCSVANLYYLSPDNDLRLVFNWIITAIIVLKTYIFINPTARKGVCEKVGWNINKGNKNA